MSNPLKYVTSTPTGTLRHANLGAGVSSIQYDETFNSGLNPSTLTTYYLVYEPVEGAAVRIYAPANAAELIQLAQSKGSSETTEAGALTWLSANGYYPVNKVLDNTVTDGLILLFDSRTATSYPRSGTDILDLSGGATDGTLYNGTTFNSDSETLHFDGVDDYVLTITNITATGDQSIETTIKFDSLESFLQGLVSNHDYVNTSNFGINQVQTNKIGISIGYTNGSREYQDKYSNTAVVTGRFYHIVMTFNLSANQCKLYIDGELDSTFNLTKTVKYTSRPMVLGRWDYQYTNYYFDGNIAKSNYYNETLSQSEINQNYYQGSIVTDNLVGAFDPSNLVSYEPVTTTTFSLTGSAGAAGDGTLNNGVAYSDSGGGAWVLDGVDDYISFGNPSSMSNAQVTVTFWYNPTTLMNSTHNGVLNGKTPGGKFCLFWINGTTLSTQYKDNSGLSAADGGIWTRSTSPVSISANKWYFIQITGNETTNEWRVGVDLNVSTTSFSSQYVDPNPTNWLLGRRNGTAADHSQIANLQIYNRILSQVEIEQNYNASINKFN